MMSINLIVIYSSTLYNFFIQKIKLPAMHGIVIINEITKPIILSVRLALVAKNIRNWSTINRTINKIISAAKTPEANGRV